MSLSSSLRLLLLPIPHEAEADVNQVFADSAAQLELDDSELVLWTRSQIRTWKDEGSPSHELQQLTTSVLSSIPGDFGRRIAEGYFNLFYSLIVDGVHSFEATRMFLSRSHAIWRLATDFMQSASMISRSLAVDMPASAFSAGDVQAVLRKLGVACSLDVERLRSLNETEKQFEQSLFADADHDGCASIVADAAEDCGYEGRLDQDFLNLVYRVEETWAYVQVLHHLCHVIEFYDHPPTYVYEFSPRGRPVNEAVLPEYPSTRASGNPFLNNMKAVYRLDNGWADQKRAAERTQSRSLVAILEALESLPFPARRELALVIRCWAFRMVQLHRAPAEPIELNNQRFNTLVTRFSNANSGTFGIVEQRLVDVFAESQHAADEWISRGIGDSVNASNTSRAKLGDCEFESRREARIVAYEAHGGCLKRYYVNEHLASLRRTLEARRDELEARAELREWKIEIVFVANSLFGDLGSADHEVIGDVRVDLRFVTFPDIINEGNWATTSAARFCNLLNRRCVPMSVRERIASHTVRNRS